MTRHATRSGLRTVLVPLLLAAALGLTACAGSGAESEGDSALGGDAPAAAREEGADGVFADNGSDVGAPDLDEAQEPEPAASRPGGGSAQAQARPPVREAAIISTGTITIRSDDVAAARFDLDKVLDAHAGTIADEKTVATEDGDVRMSRVVCRVPVEDFDEAMADLARLGEVASATRKSEDVTTQVIDVAARIRAQEDSLARVELLLARARSIRDIVSIEAQLTRRQAELDSLKSQQAWLADQTSLSTITVYLERKPEPSKPAAKDDHNAFVSGLSSGWDAMSSLGSGLAKVSGVLLPFAVVLLLLGLPTWLLLRPTLRRRTAPPPAGPTPDAP